MSRLSDLFWHTLTAIPAALYGGVMRFRNHLYDIGSKPEIHFELPVIGVGNLTVGGTGKTPMTEYLIRLLMNEKKVAVLSRGYGRKTKGFLLADTTATADTLGDEPMQYFSKFGDAVAVAVGEDRTAAIPEILFARPETEVIILDDAYQHRKIGRTVNLLLTDFQRPFYADFVMPRGRLREARAGAVRADAVVVTKCPETLTEADKRQIRTNILRYAKPETPVFFASVEYEPPKVFWGNEPNLADGEKVILVSGIARHQTWENAMRERFYAVEAFRYPDHYRYKGDDAAKLATACLKHGAALLCTEKDMVKLKNLFTKYRFDIPAFFQPIRTKFLADEPIFQQLIFSALNK